MCDDGGEGSAYAFCEPGNRSHSLPAAVHFTGDLPSLQAMPNLTLDALPALTWCTKLLVGWTRGGRYNDLCPLLSLRTMPLWKHRAGHLQCYSRAGRTTERGGESRENSPTNPVLAPARNQNHTRKYVTRKRSRVTS